MALAKKTQIVGGAKTLRRLEYHPKSFMQRGAVVPFTTRTLVQSRIRPASSDRIERGHGPIEAMLPGFSGGTSVYVTPLSQIDEIVNMTVHDRALVELLIETQSSSPVAIRACWRDVAKSGLGGTSQAMMAEAMDASDAETFRADRIVLLRTLARAEGLELPEDLAVNLMSRIGGDVFRSAVQAFSAAGSRHGAAMSSRFSDIADTVSGVGLQVSPKPGRLRGTISRLSELARMLELWGHETMAESGSTALLCSQAAEVGQELSARTLSEIDNLTRDLPRLSQEWEKIKPRLSAEVERLFWLIDGWDHLINIWDDVIARRALAEDVVPEMARLLPIVPPDEIPAEMSEGSQGTDVEMNHV